MERTTTGIPVNIIQLNIQHSTFNIDRYRIDSKIKLNKEIALTKAKVGTTFFSKCLDDERCYDSRSVSLLNLYISASNQVECNHAPTTTLQTCILSCL